MLPSWCRDAVTVVRPAATEQRGTVVPDWANAQRHSVTGCSVQVPTTSMALDGREQTALRGTLYAPPTASIRAGDRIEWTDFTGVAHSFLVDGEPMPWQSPTGRVTHIQARLAEWEG